MKNIILILFLSIGFIGAASAESVESNILKLKSLNSCEDCNLSEANLSGADLKGGNLFGANLTLANLMGANLSGAILTGADLRVATLTGADLSRAKLFKANLMAANLTGANLMGANLMGANLGGADLMGANLTGANLMGANLIDTNLTDANITGTYLREANLTRANLRGVNLRDVSITNLAGANLTNIKNPPTKLVKFKEKFDREKKEKEKLLKAVKINLTCISCNLSGLNFQGETLERVILKESSLINANFSKANLKYADLTYTDLFEANLTGANLYTANLTGADLTRANLTRANLMGANLKDTDLSDANLTGANLTNANLTGANFTGVNFREANLRGADLTNTINLPEEIFKALEKFSKEKELHNKIKTILKPYQYSQSTTDEKLEVLIQVNNYLRRNEEAKLNSGLKNDLALLFSKVIGISRDDSKELLNAALNNLPSQWHLIDKSISQIPNETVLIFRKLIQENKYFWIFTQTQKNSTIKNIDKSILSRIKNIKMYAYGSERNSLGNIKKVDLAYSTLVIAKNVDTEVRFTGSVQIPSGMPPKDFNLLFKLKYGNKELNTSINDNQILWSDSHNILALKTSDYGEGLFDRNYILVFGTETKWVGFKGKRKVYYPVIRGSGFNLIEMGSPSLAECMKALEGGVKFNTKDYFFNKGIYRFSIDKFSWTGDRKYFTCERYGISAEDSESYTSQRMNP